MQSLREKAQTLIRHHAALIISRPRYLVDEDGQSVELPSPPPLPSWLLRVAREGELSDSGDKEERDERG